MGLAAKGWPHVSRGACADGLGNGRHLPACPATGSWRRPPASPDELHAARAELVRLQTCIDVLLDHMQAFTETQMHLLETGKRSSQAKLAEARDSETRSAS